MRRLLAAVFPVFPLLLLLLLLCVRGSPDNSTVPSPENVVVRCGGERPTVSWDYSPQRPTIFTVRLMGSDVSSVSAQTADLELDLSRFVLPSDMMLNYFYVTVTAEQGPRRSEPRRSPSFTYNRYKTTEITCYLTFPPVKLSTDGAEATLSFENPLHFYNELRTMQRSATFHLSITAANADATIGANADATIGANADATIAGNADATIASTTQSSCAGTERVCKFVVDLPGDAEACVNVSGTIDKGAEQILVLHDHPVCATVAPSVELWLAAILSVVLLVCVCSLLMFGVCKVRAWTFPKVPTPQALVPDSWSPKLAEPSSEAVYSSIQITGTRPMTVMDPESPSPEPDQVQDEDQALIQTEDCLDDSAESTKTETMSLNSSGSETELSNYENRGCLVQMDLSGDLVQGYIG